VELKMQGVDHLSVPCFIDIDGSDGYEQVEVNECMTLTRARCRSGGFYLTTARRRQALDEMAKLQGMKPSDLPGCCAKLSNPKHKILIH
jgi:hypothetical protein